VARVLAVVPDLMLSSRVAEALGAAGHEVQVVAALPDSVDAEVIIGDLDAVDAAALAAAGPPTLGFYSHVDVDTRRAAEAAGVDAVVPRSKMVRDLPALVEGLLGA
jgi:nucleoside-diphosphate-sugar epimerase